MRGWLLGLALLGCSGGDKPEAPPPPQGPTAAEAKAFVDGVDQRLRELWTASARAQWAYATDITDEHAGSVEAAETQSMAYLTSAIKEAKRFDGVKDLDADTARKLHLLKLGSFAPAPDDELKRKELAGLLTQMEGHYGKGKFCEVEGCAEADQRDLGWAEDVLANERDWDKQLAAWKGWHDTAAAQKGRYERFVALTNEGAREIGYRDNGELWRAGYDMSPDAFDAEVERLWQQVKPLYEQLHCHVRAELSERYGAEKVPAGGPIPAHILGNMWAQDWSNLYSVLEPFPDEPDIDVTKVLQEKGYDHLRMVKGAEAFFTSIGLDPLPPTFWERSMFLKPEGKEAVCHASAWDVGLNDDLRIKMCIKINYDDYITLHHELGHNYYYHYYYKLPVLFQSGANDGFHEGIGDSIALSITPGYLQQVGLLDAVSTSDGAVINKQLQDALSKVAFLPFGRMIDKWRWDVYAGRIEPAAYNEAWWRLRKEYQGIVSPIERGPDAFDPGAKYHIPANTPYMRYFLAHILQFQFHEALCKASGHQGPLHTCSIYGNQAAGERLKAMLAMGASKPWPDALEAIAGTREMDAGAMMRYFEPLRGWLDTQNQGRTCGW